MQNVALHTRMTQKFTNLVEEHMSELTKNNKKWFCLHLLGNRFTHREMINFI